MLREFIQLPDGSKAYLSCFLRVVLIGILVFFGCIQMLHVEESDASTKLGYKEIGKASWYGPRFHGHKTASGKIFSQNKLTAAHPSLPLGTLVQVTNLKNGKKVKVTINDRGPYIGNRVIDLSHLAAKKLGMKKKGIARVKIEVKPN